MHGLVDFHLEDIGVMSSKNNERSGKLRLEQHSHGNRITNGLFVQRAVREWNQLPAKVAELRTLTRFKSALKSMQLFLILIELI